MEVITTHTNADFDTLGSMIAAKKLYPDAHLAFPGSLEVGLRSALATLELPVKIEKAKNIDLAKITRLIIVDVRSPARIGRFAEVASKPGVEVHIYDHHPSTDADISADKSVVKQYGSTTTVLTRIIIEKGIEITPEEATIMMAGIYEDTGFLSFPSTTTFDYEAASFLLTRGAELDRVAALIKKELTPAEVSVLNDLLEGETTYRIGGIDVTVATCSIVNYKGDVSILAHRMRDIENMDVLFVLAEAADRVHLVARSSATGIDAGLIAKALGGGGHKRAASATIKGMTLIEAKERLIAEVKETVLPRRGAEEIMSAPPITILATKTVAEAEQKILRYNINAMPVVRGKKLVGIITRQVVSKAIFHKLGPSPVADFMTTEFEAVSPATSIEDIREKVILLGQRLLPVTDVGKIVGVITRTDLLKILRDELIERPGGGGGGGGGIQRTKQRRVENLMRERLPRWVLRLLADAGEVADVMGFKVYAVGGFVRDLLLRRDNLDIDLVVEGDGIRFARKLAKKLSCSVKTHDRFKTAVLKSPDGFQIDVATARLEYYEKPGVLPTIELSSLKLDLYRRDFTINTLALELNPAKFGMLLDFFGAQGDIKDKTIKVIHNLSFVEDPTRILRAVRFSERFGFLIAKHTVNLIKSTVKLDIYKKVSGARLRDELKNILEEDIAAAALTKLDKLGALALVSEKIDWNKSQALLIESARDTLAWYRLLYRDDEVEGWMVFFLALTDSLTEAQLRALAKRLSIVGKRRGEILRARKEGLRALTRISKPGAIKCSDIYRYLSPLPLEVTLYIMERAGSDLVKKRVSDYITKLRDVKPHLNGKDLKRMGVKEGAGMGKVLKAL
ncbi:MAG: CBS domain-containing protein, partial [Thermodesulfobacteriota bacterium]